MYKFCSKYVSYLNVILVLRYIHFSCYPLSYDKVYLFVLSEQNTFAQPFCEVFISNMIVDYVMKYIHSLEMESNTRLES